MTCSNSDTQRSLRTLIVWLRLGVVGISVGLLIGAWRLMAALPAPVDFGLAVVACLAFAHRFERGSNGPRPDQLSH